MPLFNFAEPFAELDLLDSVERGFQRLTAARSFLNPDIVRNTASLVARHPTLPQPFVQAALLMNIGDWPSVEDIATRTAVLNDRPNFDYRTAARQSKLTEDRLAAFADRFIVKGDTPTDNPITRGVWGAVKGGVRGAFTAFDSAFDEFANAPVRQAVTDYREDGLLEAAGNLGSAFSPNAGFGFNTTRRESEEQGKSTVALQLKSYLNNESPNNRINLGTGFIPGQDEMEEGMTEDEYVHKYGLPVNTLSHQKREELQIGSRFGASTAVSPGRLIFNNVVEPGTEPHKWLSGLTDIAWNIFADPTAGAGGVAKGLKAGRAASKSFRAAAGVIDPHNSEAALKFAKIPENYGGKTYGKSVALIDETIEPPSVSNVNLTADDFPINTSKRSQYNVRFYEDTAGEIVGQASFSHTTRGIEVIDLVGKETAQVSNRFLSDANRFFKQLSQDLDEDIIATGVTDARFSNFLKSQGWEEIVDMRPIGMAADDMGSLTDELAELHELIPRAREAALDTEAHALRMPRMRKGVDPLKVDTGQRFTVDGVQARSWMNSKDGDVVATVLANRKTLTELRAILPDVKNRKLLRALQVADNPADVKQLLLPELGVTIDKVPYSGGLAHQALGTPTLGEAASYLPFTDPDMARIAGFAPSVTRQFKSTKMGRFFERMPGTHIHVDNLDQAFADVDQWMKVVGFSDELRNKHLVNWSQIQDGNGAQLYGAARELMKDSFKRTMEKDPFWHSGHRKNQTSRAVIQEVHNLFQKIDQAQMHFIDEIGNDAWFPGVKMHDAAGNPIPTPHTMTEHLQSGLSLPNPQDINRVASRIAKYGQVKSVDKNILGRTVHYALNKVWKPMALSAIAWPLKIISEEQVRLWFMGGKSAFNNPLQAVAAMTFGKVDPKGTLKAHDIFGNDLRKLKDTTPAGMNKVLDQYRSAMSMKHGGFLGPQSNVADMRKQFVKKRRGIDEDFFDNWGSVELSQMANDDIIPHIARYGVEATKKRFWDGNLREFRESLAAAIPEDGHRLLNDKKFSDLFIESYNARLHMKTGGKVSVMRGQGYNVERPGNADLIKIIESGTYKTKAGSFNLNPDNPNFNREELANLLQSKYSGSAPPVIKGVSVDSAKDKFGWEKAVDVLFEYAMSKPTNFMSRSPLFDQTMWNSVNDLIPHIHDPQQLALLRRSAEKLGKELDFTRPPAERSLTLNEVNEISGVKAAETVKKYLYDNSRPVYWSRLAENIFPFAEAWVEVNTTWMRLFAENPEKIRRLQQGIGGAQREGMITVDPETGEQNYNIPGAGMLEDIFGLDGGAISNNLVNTVSALNPLHANYLPGVGPLVQIPLSNMIPQSPDYDWMRELVAPFGAEKIEEPGDILGQGVPAGIDRLWEAIRFDDGNNKRQAGVVAEIYNQLIMSGEYDMATPEEQEEGLAKARSIAKKYDLIRAVAAFILPGTPRLRQSAKDKKGEWTLIESISNEYAKRSKREGENEAEDWLLENYALTLDHLFGGGATQSVRYRPVTEEGWENLRRNMEVYEAFPETAYFLFPDPVESKFSQEAWEAQFEEGNRVITTPEQRRISKQNIEANEYRAEAMTALADAGISPHTEEAREIMRFIDDYLREEYPDYGKTSVGIPERASEEHMIMELRGWKNLSGPVANLDHVKTVNQFFELQDGLQEIVTRDTGLVTLDSENIAAIEARELLYEAGEMAAAEDENFAEIWRKFLRNTVLTTQDKLGVDDGAEPFEKLRNRLLMQSGLYSDSPPDDDAYNPFEPSLSY